MNDRAISLDIVRAENGFIVRISRDPSRAEAYLRGANEFVARDEFDLKDVINKILKPMIDEKQRSDQRAVNF